MSTCIICGHKIKKMNDPLKRRQDTMSIQLHEKWICGMCVDDIKNDYDNTHVRKAIEYEV